MPNAQGGTYTFQLGTNGGPDQEYGLRCSGHRLLGTTTGGVSSKASTVRSTVVRIDASGTARNGATTTSSVDTRDDSSYAEARCGGRGPVVVGGPAGEG